jgi:CPA2 family monovalent cation:H+ antiporter-2
LVFNAMDPLQKWIRAKSALARALESRTDPLSALPASVESAHVTAHVILVGYGQVGHRIGEAFLERNLAFVVADQNREIVEKLRQRGLRAVFGEASDPSVLIQAHIARARTLIIAIPDTFRVKKMLETARALNPGIETIVRAHSDDESERLRKENVGKVLMGESELAQSITRYVMEKAAGKV